VMNARRNRTRIPVHTRAHGEHRRHTGPSVRHAEWCCPVVPNVTPPYTADDTPRVAATFPTIS
jgi:hypothetical protein